MKVAKYHACGNDFIIVREKEVDQPASFAKQICHRHLGIGADGLILVDENPLKMTVYNQDGSKAEMCGNGLRCFVHYCYDEGIISGSICNVHSEAGVYECRRISVEPFVVRVNMKQISLKPYQNTMVVGVPHKVFLKNELILDEGLLANISKKENTNVDWIEVLNSHAIRVVTYERGVGVSKACGSGCCASAAYVYRNGYCENQIDCILDYGMIQIMIEDENIIMQGPSVKVMEGSV